MVLDSKRAIVGVFRSKDVCDQIYQAGEGLITRVKHASTLQELKSAHQGLQQVLLPLIKGGIHPRLVFAMASGFSDAMIVRAIELAIQEQGKPPVPFAFVCLGSEGRQEETLLTDQDNALVYANVQGENASQVQNYFNMLAQKVCKLLHLVGYTYCHGNIMAQNPQYCLPVDAWKKQFLGWINTPDAKNILEASVFFDLRTVYGDASLTQVLHETIAEGIQKQALFLYHMALNSANVKLPQLASGTLLHDKTSESFDLKQAIAPITMLVRSYALRHKLLVSNTFKRMEVLQELKVLSHAKVAEMLVVYEFLMKLRLQNQADLLQGGFAITNLLNSKKMTELELATLKKALAQIHDFQEGIKADFRITT
jgi:CBS domain-containing protein